MTEKFWIILIVAVAVVVVVFILRRRLKSLDLKGMGMEAGVQTHEEILNKSGEVRRAGVSIRGFKQTGSRNELNIGQKDVDVERTKQTGRDQKIVVRPEKPEAN